MSTSSKPKIACTALSCVSVVLERGNTSSTSHTPTRRIPSWQRARGAGTKRRSGASRRRGTAERQRRIARVEDRDRPVDRLPVDRVVDGDARLARGLSDRQALRQRPVEVLRERRRRRVEHAVLIGDERRQSVRHERLRDALVEVGAAAAAALARVQEHEAEAALAEDLAHLALAERVSRRRARSRTRDSPCRRSSSNTPCPMKCTIW